ncbi:MAG: twin-arginine translocase TatA/TatE family subunit [Coriobacteriaceae bacterium]|nr:twin-arginine translocase TatA/TatE family subunit [Coriobacteriaceae bacterium]
MFPKGFEWVVILIVVLLIFGPKNLPKLGKSLGKTVKNIREGMSGDGDAEETESETIVDEDDEDAEIRDLEAKLAEAKAKKQDAVNAE